MSTLGSLAGRVALVTGAGSETGIGYSTARVLGELGARVVITSTTERIYERVDALGKLGIVAAGYVADLTDPFAVEQLRDVSLSAFGRVDILINNAGMTSLHQGSDVIGVLESLTVQAWHTGLERNLSTAFMVTRAFVGPMKERGWGRVVMIASTTGAVNSMPGHAIYATAKAAMIGLTRSLALEVASRGVTVNAVGPGWIATGSASAEEIAFGNASPLGRSGSPEEVAAVAGALCLPGMSYVTGQLIVVDGGNSIAEARAVGDR
ncbi:MAG: SDR family NAD(P)-dependent oxidoreductase [Ferrimicrobium sp.]|jgi:3-oxoacyl-[acyl-carrier protein] reductase|uniref:SDR family NAD(P)-dependent oxidoreductase n=1 Tax=Ferrimicrobium acidiphilum TaxID=121039 RepID=A0ABV3Y5K1_9ACTN|nr:SDR family NAD(P)-dependent oxidoreductase [Ferrimicrobium sp.]